MDDLNLTERERTIYKLLSDRGYATIEEMSAVMEEHGYSSRAFPTVMANLKKKLSPKKIMIVPSKDYYCLVNLNA